MYTWNDGTSALMHHGIKGQKWGVRRWQNESGQLINDGYEHYYGHPRQKNDGMTNKEKKTVIKKALNDQSTKYERYTNERNKHEERVESEINKRVRKATGYKTLEDLEDAALKENPSTPYDKSLWKQYNTFEDQLFNLRKTESLELKKAREEYENVAKDFVENWVNKNGSLRYDESVLNYSPKTYNHEHQQWYEDVGSLIDSYVDNDNYQWRETSDGKAFEIVKIK